jgi:hypothetical protein
VRETASPDRHNLVDIKALMLQAEISSFKGKTKIGKNSKTAHWRREDGFAI